MSDAGAVRCRPRGGLMDLSFVNAGGKCSDLLIQALIGRDSWKIARCGGEVGLSIGRQQFVVDWAADMLYAHRYSTRFTG